MAVEAELVSKEREDWLSPGERVLVEAKPHWKSFVGVALRGLVVGLGLAAAGYWHAAHAGQYAREEHVRAAQFAHRVAEHKTHGLTLEILGAVVFLLVLVLGFIRWRSTRYFVTDQRVVARRGLLVQAGTDVPLGKVDAIRFRRGVTDRVFSTGTLVVGPGFFRSVRLWSIRDWHEAHTKIHEGQRAVAAQPVGPRQAPRQGPGPQYGTAPLGAPPVSGGYVAPPPVSAVPHPPAPSAHAAPPPPAPSSRQGNDGPPIPPWARDDPDAPTINL